jgi:hypothetical protein
MDMTILALLLMYSYWRTPVWWISALQGTLKDIQNQPHGMLGPLLEGSWQLVQKTHLQ